MIKLNYINYTFQKNLMKYMLYSKDCILISEEKKSKPCDQSDVEQKKMNQKTIAIIRKWLDLSIYPLVQVKTVAYKIWKFFKELYERKNMQENMFDQVNMK